MTKKKLNSLKESAFFIKNAILKPKEVAYFFPSSKALIQAIARKAELKEAKHIIELGPGTGGTSKGILAEMADDAELCAVEINKGFAEHLSKSIDDPRFKVCHDGAQNLTKILENLKWPHADVIVSGIPFSTLPPDIAQEIIQSIFQNIKPGGLFVAYQLRDRVGQLATPLFGAAVVHWEYKNFPPMRIFIWEK